VSEGGDVSAYVVSDSDEGSRTGISIFQSNSSLKNPFVFGAVAAPNFKMADRVRHGHHPFLGGILPPTRGQ
jgi:hypothetical protein